MTTGFKITFDYIRDEQIKWRPPLNRWRQLPAHFFKSWKQAPRDSHYRAIGKEICKLARRFGDDPFFGPLRTALPGIKCAYSMIDEKHGSVILEVEVFIQSYPEEFGRDVDVVDCRIRMRKAT